MYIIYATLVLILIGILYAFILHLNMRSYFPNSSTRVCL